LWTTVNQILSLFATDPELTQIVQRLTLTRDAELDTAQRQALESTLANRLYSHDLALPGPSEMAVVLDLVYDELVGLSVLGPFWRDDRISEIMVDAWDEVVVERNGVLIDTPLTFRDLAHAQAVSRNLASKISDRQLAPKTPLVSAVLPGARITFAINPVVRTGVSISLRKFMPLLDMDKLLSMVALDVEMRDFLADCVAAGANIVVSGGTGTGKTTFVNALSEFIPTTERIVTIEDVFELRLVGPGGSPRRKWVAMQTKEAASGDDTVHISTADLLNNSLRMRPDRIMVGEVREAAAASVLMQAANTGHEGTMCTVHASDPDRALNFRLANWVRTGTAAASMTNDVACAEVAHAFDLVVQVDRESSRRFVSSIGVVDASLISGDFVHAQPVFSGRVEAGVPRFERHGPLRTDTDVARKLAGHGRLERWSAP
jgi:pilus assembly protein CpaF